MVITGPAFICIPEKELEDLRAAKKENAELREALEEIASWSQDTHLLWWQKRARAALANKGEK